jgi:hypothetical protein
MKPPPDWWIKPRRRWSDLSRGVRFSSIGIGLLSLTLVGNQFIRVLEPHSVAWDWAVRLNWTCWLIGGAVVVYGVGRIFAIELNEPSS